MVQLTITTENVKSYWSGKGIWGKPPVKITHLVIFTDLNRQVEQRYFCWAEFYHPCEKTHS